MIEIIGVAVTKCSGTPIVTSVVGGVVISPQYEAEVLYTLRSNSRTEGPIAMVSYAGLPSYYDPFVFGSESRSDLCLTKKEIESFERNNCDGFDATVRCAYHYTPPASRRGEPPTANDPFTLAMTLCEVEEPVRYDLSGARISNSAGEFFYDPITRKRYDVEYRISRQEFVNPMAKALSYSNRINSTTIWGWSAGKLRIAIEHNVDSSKRGWNVTYTIRSNALGWNPQVLDQGFKYRKNGKLVAIVDGDGSEISTPRNLDGSGRQLTAGATPVYVGPFSLYETADFLQLLLPDISVFY